MGTGAPSLQVCEEVGGLATQCRRLLDTGEGSRDTLRAMTGADGVSPPNAMVDLPGEVGTIESLLNELQDQANEISGLIVNLRRRL